MTRIVAYRDGISVELDAPDEQIELNFQQEDLRVPGSKTAPFSLTFKMPFTAANMKFFGFVNDLTIVSSDFSMNQKVQATIYEGGVEVMDGLLQVKGVDLNRQVFNCNFYASLVDLFQSLRGKRWVDVWTDESGVVDCPLDHTLNVTNVINCWNGITPEGVNPAIVPPGTIQYPLTDNGGQPIGDGTQPASVFDCWGSGANAAGLYPTNLHPAIKLKWLVDAMLGYVGYTRTTDFFDSQPANNDNLYCMVGLHAQVVDTRPSYGFRAGATVDVFNLNPQPLLYFINQWDTVNAPFYDPDDLLLSNSYLDLNLIGQYVIEVTIEVSGSLLNGAWTSELRFINQFSTVLATCPFQAGAADNDPVTVTANIDFNGTDLIFVLLSTAVSNRTFTFDMTYLYLSQGPFGQQQGVLDMPAVMGQEPLDKWLKGITDTFNLVLTIDEHAKTVTFTPFDDYIGSGVTLDWTHKIDMDGPMELLPATSYQNARLDLTPAETLDHRSRYFQNVFGQRKGQFLYVAPNDFATGENTVNDFFGLMRLTNLKWYVNPYTGQAIDVGPEGYGISSNIVISELWSVSGRLSAEYESMPPILMYYHGLQPILDQGEDLQFVGGTSFNGKVPLFTPYSGNTDGQTSVSLEYALTAPDIVSTDVVRPPSTGLLETYWGNYIQGIYGDDARVMNCKVLLTPADIYNLNFSDIIRVRNTDFRVMAVRNYVVGKLEPVQVVLFKQARGALYDCDLRPQILRSGVVAWFDAAGESVTGNFACCNSYGWNWQEDRQACLAISRRTLDRTSAQFNYASAAIAVGGQGISSEGVRTTYSNYLSGTYTEEVFEMIAVTTNATATVATGIVMEQRTFNVGDNRTVNITIDWMAVQTSGANKGASSSGEDVFLVDTVNTSSSKTDGTIYSRGTNGLSVDVVTTDATGGSSFQIKCTGLASTNFDWFLAIRIREYDASQVQGPAIPSYATFQDIDPYLFQDGTQMIWNA